MVLRTGGTPNWDPTKYPGTGSRNNLRIAAITYSVAGEGLYREGASATGVSEAVIDTLHGFAHVWVPNFGSSSVRSVVVAIDMGEDYPPAGGMNPRKLYYGYSFGVEEANPAPSQPISLTATQTGTAPGKTHISLQWTDPSGCGASGYSIQQSPNNTASFAAAGSVPSGTFQFADTISTASLHFYRVITGGAPPCTSNVATIGGYVNPSATIGGNIYVGGDINMDATATLTVLPGTVVRCATTDTRQHGYNTSKVEIIVDGKLEAIGTAVDSVRWTSASATPTPGAWSGLHFKTNTNDSHLDYNAVTYAVHGLKAEGNDTVFVQHSAVRHSQFYGVYAFNNAAASVSNCILEMNHGAETAAAAASIVDVRESFLRYSPSLGSGLVDDGAVYSAAGGGIFRRNRVVGQGMGLYCVGNGSSPTLVGEGTTGTQRWGQNDILDFQSYGVRVTDQAEPLLGTSSQSSNYLAGRNNVFSRTYPTALWVSHWTTGSPALSARYNYWGAASPDANRFAGNIDGDTESNKFLTQFESEAGPPQNDYYPGYQGAGSVVASELLFEIALGKEISGDRTGAVTGYREIVTGYPNDVVAPRALSRLLTLQLQDGRAGDELEYTRMLAAGTVSSLKKVAGRRLPALLLYSGAVNEAIREYEKVLEDPETDMAGALLEMALNTGLVLRDVAKSRDAIASLQRFSSDYYTLKHARAMLQDIVGSDIWMAVEEPRPGQGASSEDAAVSSVPTLEQNYPNPSNPRTTLAFSMPSDGLARLQIFDIHGRLVRTLVDRPVGAGRHEFSWDGRSQAGGTVSSGVYYYRLEALGTTASRRLLMVK